MTTPQQVLDIARAEIGTTEHPPNSNRTKYGDAFGLNGQPWCAIFVWWVFNEAGASDALPVKTASVYSLRNHFSIRGQLHSDPQVGDVVLYSYGQGHTGIVESFTYANVTVIEGNTGLVNQTNGGEVMRRTRPRNSSILGYGRPLYITPQPKQETPVPDQIEQPAAKCVWDDGAYANVYANGDVWAYGAKYWGGMSNLREDAKVGFVQARGIRPVDPKDSQAGYIIGDKTEFAFKAGTKEAFFKS